MDFFWLITFIVFIIIEIISFNLVTIWLALGAIIAGLSSFYIDDIYIQTIIFLISAIISLIITRPILGKYYKNRKTEKTNFDRIIGETGIITKEIKTLEYGEVKIDGKFWTAKANENIDIGEEVIIDAVEGVKLLVRKEKK